jgi:hypothetical protein
MPTSRPAWPILSFGQCTVSLRALILLAAPLALAGCSDNRPFPIVPVSGKVSIAKPIVADRIVVTFIPQAGEIKGKIAPAAARGEVNPQTGEFTSLTTLTGGDGAVVGRHKVTLVAVKNSPAGVPMPLPAIPAKYQNAKTTPLEFEVKSSGSNFAELAIDPK